MVRKIISYILLIISISVICYLWNFSILRILLESNLIKEICCYPLFSFNIWLNSLLLALAGLIIFYKRSKLSVFYKRFYKSLLEFGALQQHYVFLIISGIFISSLIFNSNLFQIAFIFKGDYLVCIIMFMIVMPFFKEKEIEYCNNPEKNIYDEAPIESFEEDRLNFIETVEKITAYLITRENGQKAISIGLRGIWGSGKTSLINLIKLYLMKQKKSGKIPVYKNFRSFDIDVAKYEDVSLLYIHFFYELINDLEKDFLLPRIDINIILSNMIENLFKGINVSALQNRIMKLPKIEKYLGKISEWLCLTNSVVICYLDDIDRITPKQVDGVFKLIRLVKKNMRNVILISAADMEIYNQYYNGIGTS